MGCDIHAMIERRHSKYYFWINAGDPGLHRDYALFAVLAGVRDWGVFTPISGPRGVPSDVCEPMEDWAEQSGCHSASWLSLAELKAARHSSPEIKKEEFALSLAHFDSLIAEMVRAKRDGQTDEDVRLVFFFED